MLVSRRVTSFFVFFFFFVLDLYYLFNPTPKISEPPPKSSHLAAGRSVAGRGQPPVPGAALRR